MLENLDLDIDDKRWRQIPKLREELERVTKITLASLPKNITFPTSFTLLLTNDARLRRLNRDFRGQDKPTNVLSFPQFEASELTKNGKGKGPIALGDIALAYQYVVGEAQKDNKILINHVSHLLIHGLLHLFGYDHMSEAEALSMERLEKRVMAKLGLPDPYKVAEMVRAKSKSAKRNQKKKYRHTK